MPPLAGWAFSTFAPRCRPTLSSGTRLGAGLVLMSSGVAVLAFIQVGAEVTVTRSLAEPPLKPVLHGHPQGIVPIPPPIFPNLRLFEDGEEAASYWRSTPPDGLPLPLSMLSGRRVVLP